MCNKPRVHACQQCGKGFTDRKRKYCTNECYQAAALRRRRKPEALKQCLRCGQDFHSNKRKYCSFACYYSTSLERTANRNKVNVGDYLKARDMNNSDLVEAAHIEATRLHAANVELATIWAMPQPTVEEMIAKANDLEQQVRRLERENERAWKVVDALIEKHEGDE